MWATKHHIPSSSLCPTNLICRLWWFQIESILLIKVYRMKFKWAINIVCFEHHVAGEISAIIISVLIFVWRNFYNWFFNCSLTFLVEVKLRKRICSCFFLWINININEIWIFHTSWRIGSSMRLNDFVSLNSRLWNISSGLQSATCKFISWL